MNDGFQAYTLINLIANTPGRLEKERLVGELAKLEIGQFVLKWAYDPFITFGVSCPNPDVFGKMSFKPSIVERILNKLASRELTGHAAQREIAEIMEYLDEAGAKMFYWILSKDLKAGISTTTINSVIPGLIPVFAVQRAHPYEEKKVKKWPVVGEPKLDGMRVTFRAREGHGGFFSRSGKRFPALDFLVEPVIQTALKVLATSNNEALRFTLSTRPGDLARNAREDLNFMLDGEVMTGLFNTTGSVRRKSEQAEGAEIHLFDLLSGADFDAIGNSGPEWNVRRKMVEEFHRTAREAGIDAIQILPRYFLNNDAQVQEFYDKFSNRSLASYLARGNAEREAELVPLTMDNATGRPKTLEGMIVKHTDAQYEKRKSYTWMKLKGEETEDLKIIGAYPGEPDTKYEHCLGGLSVNRSGVKVDVGGGFTDAEREEIWKLYMEDQAAALAGDMTIAISGGWKLLGRLIEVKFHEVTPDGSLRHPVFKCFRDDKDGEVEKVAA
ncbi:hypothetical protein [Phyllobacterium myrsinacearum]|uniref:ATP-dependent DNA ligase n=1 Tax=Phyllobacterium myrsinacearum TaxID=28101 RepID=A0A839ENV2_9HYPH|nr:hypothetical protein [Phyllobacterium myrsinacearum]MBA8881761.1 ATP-dependent DNA ligase [Phyllobacterium myrsinacearum]